MNPAELRGLLAKAQVRLLELEQAVERSDSLIAELLCERVSLRRDVAEWERIAAQRAERIVALEQRLPQE